MVETPSGLLLAEVNHLNCSYCGLCTQVCPGTHLEKGLLSPKVDPFKGNVIAAYCGQAMDKDLLQNGQSGGVATALLCHLLETGRIDRALVTQMREDGSLRPKCIVTDDKKEISQAQGSKYCPVPLNAIVPENFGNSKEKIAIVGLPCHIHGLRNVRLHAGTSEPTDPLVIGLICEGILSYRAIDYLIDKAVCLPADVLNFRFKSKRWRGWPGDTYIRTRANNEVFLANKHRIMIKDTFRPLRCRLCFDKINVLSDIVLGDAWGVREDKQGFSAIIARTQQGQDALLAARDAGVLELDPVEPEVIFKGQRIEWKRRDWTAYVHVWKQMGGSVPDFNIHTRWHADIRNVSLKPYSRKLKWAKQLASRSSAFEVLKAGKRHVRLQRLWRGLTPRGAIGFVWRRLKKLVEKILVTGTCDTLER